jgi:hypothetical protein
MFEPREGKLINGGSTEALSYANDLYSKVMLMCQDWHLVDEAKAQLIIEYAQDALKAFGDTNQEKKVQLKEILNKVEPLVSPDSIDTLKKRLQRIILRSIYPKNKHLRNVLLITFVMIWIVGLGIPSFFYLRNYLKLPRIHSNPVLQDEAQIIVDKATVSLDLTSKWVELTRDQREHERLSEGILRGEFSDVRKLSEDATFIHRVGTSSNFPPEWRNISPHNVTYKDEPERKCNPKTKYAYTLYFDISKEKVNIPFNLSYEIDFWNAHNGEAGDWQSFFVSRPTRQLVMRVSFPKNKPYTHLHFMHAYGIDCHETDLKDFPNPNYKETIDEETGAKVVTWTIDSPQDLWIYYIGWDW